MAISVTSRLKKHLDLEVKLNELKVDAAFQDLLRDNEIVTSDHLYDACLEKKIPVRIIAATIPGLFRRFKKANVIVKTHNYALSHRHHKPLPWYVSQTFTGKRIYTIKDGYLKTLDGSKLNVE